MALNSQVRINNNVIGNGFRPYIIAEMACSHNGNYAEAIKLIEAAHESKADAVQLQFFVPESTVTPHHEVFSVLQKIAFSKDDWRRIFNHAKTLKMDVWVCTYDLPSVQWAKEFGADGIKLNSADLSNPQVIEAVAKTGIPFTLGTGASTMEEINDALSIATAAGAKDIILMHGVQNFPTAVENLYIARIRLLKKVFPSLAVGYADHTAGDDEFSKLSDLVAVGLEANLIEKHITLSRSAKGIDYQAALEPLELNEFVARIHKAYLAFGDDLIHPFSESDLRYRKFQKKSIVANVDLKEGDKLDSSHVIFLRNSESGLSPKELKLLLGKKIIRNISKHQNINLSDVVE